jgi:hypothetical protein
LSHIITPHMLLKVETISLFMGKDIVSGKIFDGLDANFPNHILDRDGI